MSNTYATTSLLLEENISTYIENLAKFARNTLHILGWKFPSPVHTAFCGTLTAQVTK